MKHKVFSKINELPSGNATDIYTDGCVVMEGGAFRGIYVAAALDALMENGINLRCAIGVSAGALNGMNYISGQIGRAGKITLNHRFDKKYVGGRVLIKNRSIFGYDYAFNELMKKYPFNQERFQSGKQRFVIVATNLKTAKAEYFENGCCDVYKVLEASSSLPYVSKPVQINGAPYLDGGCSDKVPYQWALDNGYEKVIVIKTQQDGFRKSETSERSKKLAEKVYHKFPEFARLLGENNEMYNKQLDNLDKLRDEGKVFVISPTEPVDVSRFESDIEKLGELYYMGYNDTIRLIPEIKKYLGLN